MHIFQGVCMKPAYILAFNGSFMHKLFRGMIFYTTGAGRGRDQSLLSKPKCFASLRR